MPIQSFQGVSPTVADSCFIAADAWVIGKVSLAENASVFFGSVLRGDLEPIIIGQASNIQDHVVIHTTKGLCPTTVGAQVTIGHRAILHSCTVKDKATIGMGAIVLDEAEIGEESLVGAGSVVTPRTSIPPRSLVLGAPGKVVRVLTAAEIANYAAIAARYVGVAATYKSAQQRN